MTHYYDQDGNPVMDTLVWAKLFEDENYRQVAYDQIGQVKISTVWLGLDHSFGSGPRLIFETMVFGGAHDEEQVRYSTKEQALAGHQAMVERVTREDAGGEYES